jgi:phosphoribosylanthranilate isomerase
VLVISFRQFHHRQERNMTKIKICGVNNLDDALAAARAGADMLGINCYSRSARYIAPDEASRLCTDLRAQLGDSCPALVGVFVNASADHITATMKAIGLDFAQLSGNEDPSILATLQGIAFKALHPDNSEQACAQMRDFARYSPTDERIPSVLVDAYHPQLYGGTGESASVEVAVAVRDRTPRMMLAGGLNPQNVQERVAAIRPWGVDVASGVEVEGKPGKKDHARIRAFIDAVNNGDGA